MGKTLTEKLIAAHLVSGTMEPGTEVALRIDQTLTQDATGTMAYLEFESMGIDRVRTKRSVAYIDHNTLQSGFENADDHRYIQTVAAKHGIWFSRPGNGICHQVHLERFGVPGQTLIGSDAVETYEKENTATYPESIAHVFSKQKITMPALTERDIITYFTGVRAPTFEEDFIIERGRHTHNLIHVAGIQSPGLTTAPAVAEDVADMAVRILARERPVAINPDFDPHRPGIPVLREMDDATRAEYIAKNPDYGVIVCRCEEISRGEILDALRSNVCVPTVDGVKKRVRPGMGRCQGGFCSPQVVRIIAEYLGVPLSAVRKSSADAPITFGPTKSGEVQA